MGFRNLAVLIGAAVAALAIGPDQVAGPGGRETAKDPGTVQRASRRTGAVRSRETGAGAVAGRPGTAARQSSDNDASARGQLSAHTKRRAAVDGGTLGNSATAALLCTLPEESCQAGDNAAARTSDRAGFFLADDFVPGASGDIEHVCWRGGYYDFDRQADCDVDVTGDAFEIRYFADAGGIPGEMIGWWRQLAGSLTLDGRAATGTLIALQINEYEFTATHDPVPVDAGQCYWIEITNEVAGSAGCKWLWEAAFPGNNWGFQDDEADGYGMDDALPLDSAFCIDFPLQDAESCLPDPPANDTCASASPITGSDTFLFDNTTALTDGLAHAECDVLGEAQVEADVWFCWTAPCTDVAVVRTCDVTDVDTRIAVYDGCGVCPATDAALLGCNDDRCGDVADPRQSLVAFHAVEDQSYLIRIGVYPGERRGVGSFAVTCGPAAHTGCPGTGACCDETGTNTAGCDDQSCCQLVCMCDPYCCDTEWDANCAAAGWAGAPGCGAGILCTDLCDICSGESGGDCCTSTPGMQACSEPACCEAVCDADSYCCEVEWDTGCATHGYEDNGNGARDLCPDLCGWLDCPNTSVAWLDPPDGAVDTRQPFPPTDAGERQGIRSFLVEAPPEAANLACWELSETAGDGSANRVVSASVEPDVGVRVVLERPITIGAVTTLTYRGDGSSANFTAHPANVNADAVADSADVTAFIDCCLNQQCSPTMLVEKAYRCDIDHTGKVGPSDLMRLIDLLTGSEAFTPGWSGSSLPSK